MDKFGPKADLHIHLNGCVESSKIEELALRHNLVLPNGQPIEQCLNILAPVASMQEYFLPWKIFKQLPIGKDCLSEMVESALAVLARDKVVYAEFRNSPFNIAQINDISLQEALEWLSDAIEEGYARTRVRGRLIVSLSRHEFETSHPEELLSAIRQADHAGCIIGVDVSGDEDVHVNYDVASFFRRAKEEHGLHVTVHAGETGNLENIVWAIDQCCADRVGHGLAAAQSPDLMERLVREDICIEVCLLSNLRSGRVKSLKDHPVAQFIKAGVPFVLCTDSPQVHSASLTTEYQLFIETFGYPELIDGMYQRQQKYAFSGTESSQ